jgi:hypothetical protein
MGLKTKNGIKLYQLGDRHPEQKFGPLATIGHSDNAIMAINSRQRRCPKKGEWYLSGALPKAYRSPNDLSTEYLIATIVRVKKETNYNITEKLE